MANGKITLDPIPVWAPKFSKENLQRKVGTREFEMGFRMHAISPGELMFPSFADCYQPDMVLGEIARRRLPTYVGVDLAGDKRPGNAIVAVSLDPATQKRYPVEVRHGAWKSPETADHITQVFMAHDVEFIMVENNAYQQSIIDWVQDGRSKFPWWGKVEAYTTGRGKADPQYGLPGLEVELKNKLWAVPSAEWAGHDSGCACSWCEWSRQMAMYPRGAATDLVMATWFANNAINKWGRVAGMSAGNFKGLNHR